MSLDIWLKCPHCGHDLYENAITGNLAEMADSAGLYEAMWRPDEHGFVLAGDIIQLLNDGIRTLKSDPERFKKMNPPNGWGTYDILLRTATDYFAACSAHPDALIKVWR